MRAAPNGAGRAASPAPAGVCGRPNGRSDGLFDDWQDVAHRAPVVLREIDFDPGIVPGANGVEGAVLREFPESLRRPVAEGAAGHQAIRDGHEMASAPR